MSENSKSLKKLVEDAVWEAARHSREHLYVETGELIIQHVVQSLRERWVLQDEASDEEFQEALAEYLFPI